MSAMFRSFAVRNYRLWFAGATVSNVGTWMQRTAQDWLVLTVLTDDDAAAVGVTMALQFGPNLLLTPLAGLVVDRVDRRKLLVITQVAQAVLGIGLGILAVTGLAQLWMVFGFALGLGVVTAFDAPARQTIVGVLVPPSHLSNAVALNGMSFNVARLLGPATAGLLTALLGAGPVFLLNGVSYLAVIAGILALRASDFLPEERAGRARGQIRAGFAYVRGRSDLMLVFGMIFLFGMLGMNNAIFISTMVKVEFGDGAGEFGVLSSVLAIGSIVGALLAARRDRPRLRTITVSALLFGVAMIGASLTPNALTFGAVLVAVGFCAITTLNSANAYVQTTTPPAIRGRVMSLYMAILMGGTPIGAPLLGWVANAAGPRWAVAVGALGGLLAGGIDLIWWVRDRGVRGRRTGPERRWPLTFEYATDRELVTQELAVIEAEARR